MSPQGSVTVETNRDKVQDSVHSGLTTAVKYCRRAQSGVERVRRNSLRCSGRGTRWRPRRYGGDLRPKASGCNRTWVADGG
jgi:hypothetical protein